MTISIKSDAGGTFGSLQVAGSDVLRFGSDTSGQLAGFRNKLINGAMAIWQRGTSAVGAGYRADRWNTFITAGSSLLQSQYLLTGAERAIVGFDTRAALVIATDASTSVICQQPIEGVHILAGKSVTVSFYAWCSAGTVSISAALAQSFGTGGSPSSKVSTALTLSATSVGTTPIKITATVTLPSITGKTLGSNGDDYVALQISKVIGAANNLYITKAQLEEGSIATPFEQRPIGFELSLCQRYYEIGTANIAGYSGASCDWRGTVQFKSTKRVAPTLTDGATMASGVSVYNVSSPTVSGAIIFCTTTGATSFWFSSSWTASAEL